MFRGEFTKDWAWFQQIPKQPNKTSDYQGNKTLKKLSYLVYWCVKIKHELLQPTSFWKDFLIAATLQISGSLLPRAVLSHSIAGRDWGSVSLSVGQWPKGQTQEKLQNKDLKQKKLEAQVVPVVRWWDKVLYNLVKPIILKW